MGNGSRTVAHLILNELGLLPQSEIITGRGGSRVKPTLPTKILTILIYRPTFNQRKYMNDPVSNVIPTSILSCDPSDGNHIYYHTKKVEYSLWEVLQLNDIQRAISNRMWLTGNTPTLLTSKEMNPSATAATTTTHEQENDSNTTERPASWWWWNKRRKSWLKDIQSLFVQVNANKTTASSTNNQGNQGNQDENQNKQRDYQMKRAGYLLRELASGYLQLLDDSIEIVPNAIDIETQLITEKVWNVKDTKKDVQNDKESSSGTEKSNAFYQLIHEAHQEVNSSVSIGDATGEEMVS